MRKHLILFISILFFIKPIISKAQLTEVDKSFQVGLGFNGTVRNVSVQQNGKIIACGDFTNYAGFNTNRLLRLFNNGLVDTSFKMGTGANGPIRTAVLQSDDKLIIAGLFSKYNGNTRGNIARLMPNGELDTSFHSEVGSNNEITDLFMQADGKIIIFGFFYKYNEVFYTGFARLKTNGEIDTSFATGSSTNLSPLCSAQQSNGQLLVGGSFLRYQNINVSKIFRMSSRGVLDTTFKAGTISGNISKILVLPNDQIMIAGSFTTIDGKAVLRLARLQKDGALDTTFNCNVAGTIRTLHLLPNGQIICGGDFTVVNGSMVRTIARIKTDGSLADIYTVGTNGSVFSIAMQPDRNILFGGAFTLAYPNLKPEYSSSKILRLKNYYCTAATKPKINLSLQSICPKDSFEIKIVGGNLNEASKWYWYADSVAGLPIDSGLVLKRIGLQSRNYFAIANAHCGSTKDSASFAYVNVKDTIDTRVIPLGSGPGLYSFATNALYQWVNCDSAYRFMASDTSARFTPTDNGNYAVIIWQQDCIDTSDCYYVQTTGIKTNNHTKIILPNPVAQFLQIPNSINCEAIKIYSSLGQKVLESHIGLQRYDVSNLSNGLYYVQLKSRDGEWYWAKVMKE
jgi:uncharacterized delta-60 repeat protein